jgi:hypothetical protein
MNAGFGGIAYPHFFNRRMNQKARRADLSFDRGHFRGLGDEASAAKRSYSASGGVALFVVLFAPPALAGFSSFPSGPAVAWAAVLKHDPEKACPALIAGRLAVSPRDKRESVCAETMLTRGTSLADWLVDEYLMLGLVPLQNWMLLAIAIVILSIGASAWLVRH